MIKHCALKSLSIFYLNLEINYLIYIMIDELNIFKELRNDIIEIYFLDFHSAQSESVCFCDIVRNFVFKNQSFIIRVVDLDCYYFVDKFYSFILFINLYIYSLT